MIYLPEIAQKLEELFNSNEDMDFEFSVATEGFHLDHIYNKESGNNFIPVFISSMGGSYDAVKGLNRTTQNVNVTLYFPVRFKNWFFSMNSFLVDTFVAQMVDFGELSGSCLCNISAPQFGEIVDLDLRQFKEWAGNLYKMPIDIMQPYMSMTFQLFLTNTKHNINGVGDFIYGNDVEYSLTFLHQGRIYSEILVWTSSGTGMSVSPIAQQLVNVGSYAKNVPNITNYNKSIMAYVRNNEFWQKLLTLYNSQRMNEISDLTLIKTYKSLTNSYGTQGFSITYEQIILAMNENVALGDLISFTITFGDEKKIYV